MGAIVVGYDDSSGSKAALAVAAQLAAQTGGQLVIGYGYGAPGSNVGDEIREHREALLELGQKMTDEAKSQAEAAGVDAQVELVEERGVDALLSLAETHDASFIVVGSYSESPLKGAILGSTPHKLLHLAEVPVVVVPGS